MSDWKFLNEHRVTAERPGDAPEPYWTTPEDGWNGMFIFFCHNQRVRCVSSDGMLWKHVSVSIIGDKRTPKWEMMCAIKSLFWDDEDVVVQYHPAKSKNISLHPGCLHLWQPLNEKLPLPDPRMVGPVTT
jgi:hypothetical protein